MLADIQAVEGPTCMDALAIHIHARLHPTEPVEHGNLRKVVRDLYQVTTRKGQAVDKAQALLKQAEEKVQKAQAAVDAAKAEHEAAHAHGRLIVVRAAAARHRADE